MLSPLPYYNKDRQIHLVKKKDKPLEDLSFLYKYQKKKTASRKGDLY